MIGVTAVVLAAGQGTRMESPLPKVLHPLAGRSLLGWVLRAGRRAGIDEHVVVVGHRAELVEEETRAALRVERGETDPSEDLADELRVEGWLRFALQKEQRGTGHAVLCALDALPAAGFAVILSGDVPLVRPTTIVELVRAARSSPGGLALASFRPADPTGYGRVLRDASGRVTAIREHKDASPDERTVAECNAGLYCADIEALRRELPTLRADNAQGELYLTDLVERLAPAGVTALEVTAREVAGINTRAQLQEMEETLTSLDHSADVVQSRFVELSGLRHRLLVYGEGRRPWLFLHGFLDQGEGFDAVARFLVAAGEGPIWTLDFRGHGGSAWIPREGGYYHFPDYVRDVWALCRSELAGGAPFQLVGHSMGGTVATYLAALAPVGLASLSLLEGLGPPGLHPEDAPDRMAAWLTSLDALPSGRRIFPSLEEAADRARAAFPDLSRPSVLDYVRRGLEPVAGGWAWRYDPLHRTRSPSPFQSAVYQAFAGRVRVPVLLVEGGKSTFSTTDDPDLVRRAASFVSPPKRVTIPGAGHMMHVSHPRSVAAALLEFVAGR